MCSQHDGLEKKHSWLLDEIEVTNLGTEEKWGFPCQAWLSLFLADHRVKRELRAAVMDTPLVGQYPANCLSSYVQL